MGSHLLLREGKLITCNGNLASTDLPANSDCYCGPGVFGCFELIDDGHCAPFCTLPVIAGTGWIGPPGSETTFSYSFTFNLPLTANTSTSIPGQFAGYSGLWSPDVGGSGGIVGEMTLTSSSQSWDFGTVPLYSSSDEAFDACGWEGTCGVGFCSLACFNGYWRLSPIGKILIPFSWNGECCPSFEWDHGLPGGICPLNSSVFTIPSGAPQGCHGSFRSFAFNTVTGLSFHA